MYSLWDNWIGVRDCACHALCFTQSESQVLTIHTLFSWSSMQIIQLNGSLICRQIELADCQVINLSLRFIRLSWLLPFVPPYPLATQRVWV